MYRKLFVILFLCAGCFSNEAQAQTEEKARYAVSVEPFHLMNGGLRLNIEKRLRPDNWVELNLTGYSLPHRNMRPTRYGWEDNGYWTSNSDFESISGLSGLGIGGTYKHYFAPSFMINTALSYNWYNVGYSDTVYDFYPYTEDGLTFYDYKWTHISTHQNFRKLAAHVALGVRSSFQRLIFIEYYGGMGYAHSFYDTNKRSYNETMFGYGYRGVYWTLGVKLGFNLGQFGNK